MTEKLTEKLIEGLRSKCEQQNLQFDEDFVCVCNGFAVLQNEDGRVIERFGIEEIE